MSVEETIFESESGVRARVYKLIHSSGASFTIMEYAAAITEIMVPDKKGEYADVMLGFSDLDGYMENGGCHGSIVGRVANRTKGASFTINNTLYRMPANDGENNLHGGAGSFQNVFWKSSVLDNHAANEYLKNSGIRSDFLIEGAAVLLTHFSPDGTCGLPGNLTTHVLYAWTVDQTLLILYHGQTDVDTLFCPTNQSYFNLGGHNSGSVSGHLLWIDSTIMTNKDSENIPDGSFSNIEGSVFDFSKAKSFHDSMQQEDPQLASSRGLDQNYCLHTTPDEALRVALLRDPSTEREMEVITSFPGLQIYTGNHTENTVGKLGFIYDQYAGVCLEAQLYPDAIHHPDFPDAVLRAGEEKYYLTGYRFSFTS